MHLRTFLSEVMLEITPKNIKADTLVGSVTSLY